MSPDTCPNLTRVTPVALPARFFSSGTNTPEDLTGEKTVLLADGHMDGQSMVTCLRVYTEHHGNGICAGHLLTSWPTSKQRDESASGATNFYLFLLFL